MLTTQQFAALCNTTKKTIIYYDRIGLLKPFVRKKTFRKYNPKQVLIFQKIQLLKSFGLTLSEIKHSLKKTSGLSDVFTAQKKELVHEKTILEKRTAKLDEYISNLKNNKPMVVPEILSVKPYIVFGIEKTGRYVDIGNHQREAFYLIGDNAFRQVGVTIFHTGQYHPEQSQMTSGVVLKKRLSHMPDEGEIIDIPEHRAVSYIHTGTYSYLSYIWQFLDAFVKENKLKLHPTLHVREFYIVGSPIGVKEEDFITKLQIPII